MASRVDALLAEDGDDHGDDDDAPATIDQARPRASAAEPSLDTMHDHAAVEIADADVDVNLDSEPVAVAIPPPPKAPPSRPTPPPRPVVVVPPRPPVPGGPPKVPPVRPPIPRSPTSAGVSQPIPVPRRNTPAVAIPPPRTERETSEADPRARRNSSPPPGGATVPERARRGSVPPPPVPGPSPLASLISPVASATAAASATPATAPQVPIASTEAIDVTIGPPPEHVADGFEVSTATPRIVVDQPLEAHLESPTVVDRALSELGDTGSERRADAMMRELDATVDQGLAASLAYELGELYERRLADEARAVKAYGRALMLDPGLRPNLWAIRRVFYRRGLWPNLVKLIAAEVAYARDDLERADLLLEKARVAGHHLQDTSEARTALEEAVRIAPQHQGALLELERIVARAHDVPALLDVWERLADAVEQPARKVAYWLEVGRTAAPHEYARAQTAFENAAALAGDGPDGATQSERVARERLRAAEEHGTPDEVGVAIDALASQLLAAFGLAGPASSEGGVQVDGTDRAAAIRRELVALRRRQAQLARSEAPERAWDVLQQAIALAPGEPLVLADLTELAEELGRYEDLAELVQSWQAIEGDPSRAMALSMRRADALLRGGQRDQARALLASLEATAPGFVVLTSAAERDALGRGNLADLATTYLGAAAAAWLGSWVGPGHPPQPDPAAAAALYVQAAELLAYDVDPRADDDPDDRRPEKSALLDEARAALGKALEAMPAHAAAFEALVELDDATGNVAAGIARLKAAAAAVTGEAKRACLERAIRLARAHGDLESVLELESAVAELAPSDLALRWRIESTLAQLGRDDERAGLLTELAALEPDPTRRGTALLAAARVRERAGAVEAATDLYRQVLVLWPDDTFARESLVDLLRAQDKWTELVADRRAEARGLPDGASARRALREAAWVLEVRLGDVASAAQVYEEWLQRLPGDRTALEGAARCRAHFGDRGGEVAARREIADLDPTAEAQWLLGRALERAGQFDEAADSFRALAVRAEPSVAATSAALALADLAAGRADTVMRVEATAALAGRTTEPRLGAALAEDSGWMYALVLEDFDRAQQSFAAAVALEPKRRGALLGAALVAARRGDEVALSGAYDGLAAALQMPEAAAALHLRAAAMASASADLELANQRIAAARAAAPDDVSALLVIAETAPLPHSDGIRPEAVIDPLLARAEVLEMRGALADDPVARASWELDRAEALELAGRLREAVMVVVAVLKVQPEDIRALEALRRMAKRAGDDQTWARASYRLGRVIGDAAAKLAFLRDAASVIDRPLPERATDDDQAAHAQEALAIYRRMLQVDLGAPEHARLLELLRERADVNGLVAAITERLNWLEAEAQDFDRDQQMVPLLLERATVLHGLGNEEAAMEDLDSLLERAQSHVEALRFRADLALHTGDVPHAVSLWRRYLGSETRPQRRAEVELQLAQVLAEDVHDLVGAIENLESVVESRRDDLPLRERLLALCIRASEWTRAARELRMLAKLRPVPQDQAREELRLGLMLRDKLGDRPAARMAFERARNLDPLNLDVVRELSEIVEGAARTQVLATTAASFRVSITSNPKNASLYDRLAQVTGWQSEVDARWLALVALEALGTPSIDQRQVLEQGRQQLAAPGRVKLDLTARKALRGEAAGPLVELWHAIAPAVQVATGIDAGKLGFTRGDRVNVKKLGDKYEPLGRTLACFGVDDVEVYVSAARAGMARVLAAETPILCLGADVASAATPHQRWSLGRAIATLAEGFATLPDLREVELVWTIAAALRAVDATVPPALADAVAGDDASVAERVRILKKELGRKPKQAILDLARQRGSELVRVPAFRREALDVGHRAGLVWAGDLAVALAQLDVGKGGRALTDSSPALDLAAWSVGEDHVRLRELLGISLKGTR